jgi:AcrR family transcriptional regulator
MVSKTGNASEPSLRERVLKESADLFLSRGFIRVTVDEIAGRLGISKATLYKSFASKEEILRSVVGEIMTEIAAGVEGILSDARLSFVEKLVALFTYVGERLSRFGPFLVRDIQKSAPQIWKEIDDFRRNTLLKNFRVILESGRREGLFRGDIDPELLLQMFTYLIGEFINPRAILRSGRSPAEAFESVIKVFFQGILTDGGRRDFLARTPALFEPRKEDKQ